MGTCLKNCLNIRPFAAPVAASGTGICTLAQDILRRKDGTIPDKDMSKVLLAWGYDKNRGRPNVLPSGSRSSWVHSDQLGLVRSGDALVALTLRLEMPPVVGLPPVAGLPPVDPNVVPPPVAGSSPRTKRKSKPATGGRNRDYRHFGKNKKQHAYAPLSVYLHSGSSASGSSAGSGSVREYFKKRTRQASECQASLVQHWRRIARPKGRPIPDPVPADLAKESRKMIVPWLEQRKLLLLDLLHQVAVAVEALLPPGVKV